MFRALLTAIALFVPMVAQAVTDDIDMDRTVIIALGFEELKIIDRWYDSGEYLEEYQTYGDIKAARYGQLMHDYVMNAARISCLARADIALKRQGKERDMKTYFIPKMTSVSIHESSALYLLDCGETKYDNSN